MNSLKLPKPSFTVAWDKDGNHTVLKCGTVDECLAVFKKERAAKNYYEVRFWGKPPADKRARPGRVQKKIVSVSNSKYDGDEGAALKEKEEREKAEAETKEKKSPATTKPKKKG